MWPLGGYIAGYDSADFRQNAWFRQNIWNIAILQVLEFFFIFGLKFWKKEFGKILGRKIRPNVVQKSRPQIIQMGNA